jgi:hypothetical protein
MALDNKHFVSLDLCPLFVDKKLGRPLSAGTVWFFEDDNRTNPKLVYQLSVDVNNQYTYTPLGNYLTLASNGTFQDSSGNNIAVYFYPYDINGNIQLYYIAVYDAYGNPQFTREGFPNIVATPSQAASISTYINQLSNPQFADISFINQLPPASPYTITIPVNTTYNINIAPNWILNITTNATGGNGTVNIVQNPIAGSASLPFNPPYTLTITPGANIGTLSLSQTLSNDPGVWSPQNNTSLNGWISASILLGNNCGPVTMNYVPSVGLSIPLLSATNNTSAPAQYYSSPGPIQLPPSVNTSTGSTGNVQIVIGMPINIPTTISNVQILSLQSNVSNVAYDEEPVNRQRDQLFHYHYPFLRDKPIKSYLVGWDFPLNPTQPLGPTIGPIATANNSSYYWDNTIIFQSAINGITVSRAPSGALRVTANATTQFALIQYIPSYLANLLLQNYLSVNVYASTPVSGGLGGTVSLWYTNSPTLPSTITSHQSIVATLSATGKPNTFNGTWIEIPRNGIYSSVSAISLLGDAIFTIGTSSTNNYNDYSFNGWGLQGGTAVNTAEWVAIVVGFAQLTAGAGNYVDFESISLVPGNIATRPALQTADDVLRECQYYYEMSFNQGIVPAQNFGTTNGSFVFTYVNLNNISGIYTFPFIEYKVSKYSVPTTITRYNPVAANNNFANISTGGFVGGSSVFPYSFINGFCFSSDLSTGSVAAGNLIAIGWTSDARLGQ